MKKLNFFKPMDFLFFLISIGAIILSFFFISGKKNSEAMLFINSPDRQFVYPMSQDMEISVEGDIGISKIKIKDGKAFFEDSPCPNHICVETPPLRSDNDWAACLPNGVFIRIEGGKDFDGAEYIDEMMQE